MNTGDILHASNGAELALCLLEEIDDFVVGLLVVGVGHRIGRHAAVERTALLDRERRGGCSRRSRRRRRLVLLVALERALDHLLLHLLDLMEAAAVVVRVVDDDLADHWSLSPVLTIIFGLVEKKMVSVLL